MGRSCYVCPLFLLTETMSNKNENGNSHEKNPHSEISVPALATARGQIAKFLMCVVTLYFVPKRNLWGAFSLSRFLGILDKLHVMLQLRM